MRSSGGGSRRQGGDHKGCTLVAVTGRTKHGNRPEATPRRIAIVGSTRLNITANQDASESLRPNGAGQKLLRSRKASTAALSVVQSNTGLLRSSSRSKPSVAVDMCAVESSPVPGTPPEAFASTLRKPLPATRAKHQRLMASAAGDMAKFVTEIFDETECRDCDDKRARVAPLDGRIVRSSGSASSPGSARWGSEELQEPSRLEPRGTPRRFTRGRSNDGGAV